MLSGVRNLGVCFFLFLGLGDRAVGLQEFFFFEFGFWICSFKFRASGLLAVQGAGFQDLRASKFRG